LGEPLYAREGKLNTRRIRGLVSPTNLRPS
jgi:hypothetical protein